jgi:hypothetical protein
MATPIPWREILKSYSGQTIAEQFSAMRAGRTYREIAIEIGRSHSAVKTFAVTHSRLTNTDWPQRKIRGYTVQWQVRPNYKAMMDTLMSQLKTETGMSEKHFKRWINTKAGGEYLARRCHELRIPLFECKKVVASKETGTKIDAHGEDHDF